MNPVHCRRGLQHESGPEHERLVARRPKQPDQHVRQPANVAAAPVVRPRINSAADDPAGLVISSQQGAQIAGLQAAIQNTTTATTLVQTAGGALTTINDLLVQIRSLAVNSANSGVNDSNALAANQAQISNALDTINRIATNTQFGTKKLLDGSAGITGSTDNANATFLNAQTTSPTGTFAVAVTTAAQRANTTAGTAQTGALAANETLTINGVAVGLTAGQTQAQVIQTINQFTGQTGVTAQLNAGATQLYSTQYGSAAKDFRPIQRRGRRHVERFRRQPSQHPGRGRGRHHWRLRRHRQR